MADDAGGMIAKQGVSMVMNDMYPALFSMGPVGAAVAVVMMIGMATMGGGHPQEYVLVDDIEAAVADDSGMPVFTGDHSPYHNWMANLYVSFVKICKYLTDRDLDVNDIAMNLHYRAFSNGDFEMTFASNLLSQTLYYGHDRPFDAEGMFYKLVRLGLIGNNSDIPLTVRTILRDASLGDKQAIDMAVAMRKAEVDAAVIDHATAKKQLAALQTQYDKLNAASNDELARQEMAYLQDQILQLQAMTADSLNIYGSAIQVSDQVKAQQQAATVKKAAVAVPWLLILGLVS